MIFIIIGILSTHDFSLMLLFLIIGLLFTAIAIPLGISIKINKNRLNNLVKNTCVSSGSLITNMKIISSKYHPPLAEIGKSFVIHSSSTPFSMIHGPVPSKEDLGYTEHTCKCMLYNKMFVNDFIYKNQGKILDTEKEGANNIPSNQDYLIFPKRIANVQGFAEVIFKPDVENSFSITNFEKTSELAVIVDKKFDFDGELIEYVVKNPLQFSSSSSNFPHPSIRPSFSTII